MLTQLKKIRKERGLTQAALADKIGVSRVLVTKWETGVLSPSVRRLHRLAKALNAAPSDLISTGKAAAVKSAADDALLWEFMEYVAEAARKHPKLDARLLVSVGKVIYRDIQSGRLTVAKSPKTRTTTIKREIDRLAEYESDRPRA